MTATNSASQDAALCRECGGRCCKASPGIWVDPERFLAIFFAGQRLTIDELRQQLPALELVLWEKSGVPIPAPRSLTSGCAFHGADGCQLPVAERPCQCLALIPNQATLAQPRTCLCQMPEDFSWDAAREAWQRYWQSGRRQRDQAHFSGNPAGGAEMTIDKRP
ncbi:MAG: hypothetical protein R2864_08010 [Syntrophotaleaceae bacterium]